ncbi:hypothetical protein [Sphingomonas abaci]|uniref:SOS-response transcriptional repressor LexA n=1 Tax=Sphingomonas abaci TaxID=237611 RepID=A0A7W7AL99_9SPHN|nr:hypothetical protein [Sphingomonas abaci]MBB4619131.1 SOS-response transcriptional repressor LexA [Sphingomonas abaci]
MGEQSAVVVPRRVEALAYIIERIETTGTAPSYGEIAAAMNPPIERTRVRQLVDQLVEHRLIDRPISSRRGIRIRDVARCRQIIGEALGRKGWCHAQPMGELAMPPCTIEQLPLIPLILYKRDLF